MVIQMIESGLNHTNRDLNTKGIHQMVNNKNLHYIKMAISICSLRPTVININPLNSLIVSGHAIVQRSDIVGIKQNKYRTVI